MPTDRRQLLRSLSAAGAVVSLGGARTIRDLLRGVADDPLQRVEGLEPDGDASDRTRPVRLARPFSMVAARTPPGAEVSVRVSDDGERFGPWLPLHPNDVEREGPDGAEGRSATNAWKRLTTPAWTGPADWVQLHVRGVDPARIEVVALDSPARAADASAAAWSSTADIQLAATTPLTPAQLDIADATLPVGSGLNIVTREEWGADESLRRSDPSYADRVLHGVVHHTAGNNGYAPEDGPAIVRGIYRFHVQENGWNDIGYNLLVDRYGVVYEGRYGGLDLPVIGAHAQGANTGSFGVAVLGNFDLAELGYPEPRTTLFEVLAWKFGLHAIDPFATVTTASGRTGVPTLSGHRDVGSTACPGDHVHPLLDEWRQGIAEKHGSDGLTDVAGHPHEDAIRRLRASGITTGYADGTFRPDQPVERGQMSTFLARAGQLPPADSVPFTDVPAEHPHLEGIAAAWAADIAAGYGDGTFRPSDDVSRGQMASFLARALGLEPRDGTTFPDVGADHPHHGPIEAVAHADIARGSTDGTYRPDRPVTRGQMATFLVRAFDLPELDDGPQDPDEPDDEFDEDDDADDHQPDDDPEGDGEDDDGPDDDGADGEEDEDDEDGDDDAPDEDDDGDAGAGEGPAQSV